GKKGYCDESLAQRQVYTECGKDPEKEDNGQDRIQCRNPDLSEDDLAECEGEPRDPFDQRSRQRLMSPMRSHLEQRNQRADDHADKTTDEKVKNVFADLLNFFRVFVQPAGSQCLKIIDVPRETLYHDRW